MTKKKSAGREFLELVAAFVVAWVAYQLLAAAAGTPLPIVSVVSDSMYHTSHFSTWWTDNERFYTEYGITEEEFRRFPVPNGLSRGDLLFVVRADNPKPGDILIYNRANSGITIVHRLVDFDNGNYITKGDNNDRADQPIVKEQVAGKVIFALPVFGYPRLLLHSLTGI